MADLQGVHDIGTGSFAGVVRGGEEFHDGTDLVPSCRVENLNRLQHALTDLAAVCADGRPTSLDGSLEVCRL